MDKWTPLRWRDASWTQPIHAATELVVISGDLVGYPDGGGIRAFTEAARARDSTRGCSGNHDDRSLFRAAFSSQPYAQAKNALNFSLAVGP
jgi:hypothetical protein